MLVIFGSLLGVLGLVVGGLLGSLGMLGFGLRLGGFRVE